MAALLRMLKSIISDECVVKAFHAGRNLGDLIEPPEGISYPLRLVAFKTKDGDDEYSWSITWFQKRCGHSLCHTEWQLVVYAEAKPSSSGLRPSTDDDKPRAVEPLAKMEKVKPNLELSKVAANLKEPATTEDEKRKHILGGHVKLFHALAGNLVAMPERLGVPKDVPGLVMKGVPGQCKRCME